MENADAPASAAKQLTEESLFAIISQTTVGMVQTDLTGKILLVNDRFCEIVGYRCDELLSMRLHDLTHEEDLSQGAKLFEQTAAEGKPFVIEKRYVHKDGSNVWVHCTVSAILDADGKPQSILAVALDLTERKQMETDLRQSETQLQLITDSMPVLISYVDAERHYRFANKTYHDWFGHAPQEIIGKHVREIVGEAAYAEVLPALDRVFAGETLEFERLLPYQDGGSRFVSVNYVPDKDESGEVKGFYALIEDITKRKQNEEVLRQSEEKYRSLFNSIDEGFCIVEILFDEAGKPRDYRFLESNPMFGKLTGLENATGKTALELIPDLEYFWIETYGRVALTGEAVRFESHAEPMNRWFDVYASRIGDDASRKVAIVFTNTTERKRSEQVLRESEERLRLATNAAKMFSWELDTETNQTIVSENFAAVIGFSNELRPADLEQSIAALVHPQDAPVLAAAIEKTLRGTGDFRLELRAVHPETREIIWVEIQGTLIQKSGEKPLRVVGIVQNITERKKVEEELREADRRKDEFLATLAHELRNPLAPIRSGLEIIRRSDFNKTTIEQMVETIERQTNQLVHLVDDLLEISRITQGKIKLQKERIELQRAIETAVETNRELITLNGHDLTISLPAEPVFIHADLTRISQIILNLLNNSAKYTEPDGKIWLTVETNAEEVGIRVKDNGIGIPPEKLSDIFEMFTQIETTGEQARAGLGIGLSVVKSLVEMHGGTVTALSAGMGEGSEFVVRLPLSKDEGGGMRDEVEAMKDEINPSDSSLSPQHSALKILVVDDNADALEMMKVLLTLENHTVRTAFDGETAIKVAPEFQPDVCILDIGLPIMNGYELARRLREQMPQVFLIALSGWGQDEDRRRSSEAGFNHHLVKPIEMEKLESLLAEIR